jgi:hypothetical protein
VLEQVREAAASGRLVLAADVVPEVDRDDRRLAIGVHDHAQAVGQGEFLVGDVDARGACRLRHRDRREAAEAGGEGEGEQPLLNRGGARPALHRHATVLYGGWVCGTDAHPNEAWHPGH